MFKQLSKRPWICSRCLVRQQRAEKRDFLGLALTSRLEELDFLPASHASPSAAQDDGILRKIFDSQAFWKDFSSRTASAKSGKNIGLLRNKYLTSPHGFERFTSDALEKCQRIVAKVLAASSLEEYKGLLTELDRLSDQLCRVIDLVDFIRNVHPDPRIQQAASQAHGLMYQYMNVLNTNPGLNGQLKAISSMKEVVATWNDEDKMAAGILLKDFAQSAITQPQEIRENFVEVSNKIVHIGTKLLDQMAPEKAYLKFSSGRMKGMDPTVAKKFTKWGTTTLPTHGTYAALALRTVEDPEVRRELYIANRTASNDSIRLVEELVTARAELASLSGHESFAHMTLSDKMAKTPAAVMHFLEALAANNKEKVKHDIAEMVEIKKSDAHHDNFPNTINAWDRDYYAARLRSSLYANNRPADVLSSYFSLGTVMQGLSRLFDRLYGIRLVPSETQPGETWNDDVRRLDVMHETDGHIAVLYCDLFERPNKSPNPAHFTLRCSREISSLEIQEAATSLPPQPSLHDLSLALNDGMSLNYSSSTTSDRTLQQLPTIAFICDFPRPSTRSIQPALLSFRQLSTLYHEMGHALHSIVGRTKLQNVAGTRCATDFAELPSILMEHFAASPQVLSLYARHWETDEPLNVDLVSAEVAMNKRLLATAETEGQILLSVLDQQYHSAAVKAGGAWDSTAVYHAIWNDPRFSTIAEPSGTSWQGFFGHLYGYGAVYYSYLFDRAIAGKVWKDVFEGPRALDRRQGQRYHDEILKWGGSRDGWKCVAGVLGPEKHWMSEGGDAAMAEVGRWGAGDTGVAI